MHPPRPGRDGMHIGASAATLETGVTSDRPVSAAASTAPALRLLLISVPWVGGHVRFSVDRWRELADLVGRHGDLADAAAANFLTASSDAGTHLLAAVRTRKAVDDAP